MTEKLKIGDREFVDYHAETIRFPEPDFIVDRLVVEDKVFVVTKGPGCFWAEGLDLPGCRSQGDTYNELIVNLKDAIKLYCEEE